MKKLMLRFFMLAALLAPAGLAVGNAGAIDLIPGCSSGKLSQTDVCPAIKGGQDGKNNAVVDFIRSIINVLSFVIGAAAVISIIVSGLRFILANGNAADVSKARNGLIYAMVGVILVVVAQSIVAFVLSKL